MHAVQKTNRGGAECWEPVGGELQAAILAAASAIAELKDCLSAGCPGSASSLTESLGTAASEGLNMLYVAGQKLESIGRLEEARSAYSRALDATVQSPSQQPPHQRVNPPTQSQGLTTTPETELVDDIYMTRATLLYHLAHAFLLEPGRETEAVERATRAVELSPHSGTFAAMFESCLLENRG